MIPNLPYVRDCFAREAQRVEPTTPDRYLNIIFPSEGSYAALKPELRDTYLPIWIEAHLTPSKQAARYTSYGLKHLFANDMNKVGLMETDSAYTTNAQFKAALMMAGFVPFHPEEINWRFYMAVRSAKSGFYRWVRLLNERGLIEVPDERVRSLWLDNYRLTPPKPPVVHAAKPSDFS